MGIFYFLTSIIEGIKQPFIDPKIQNLMYMDKRNCQKKRGKNHKILINKWYSNNYLFKKHSFHNKKIQNLRLHLCTWVNKKTKK